MPLLRTPGRGGRRWRRGGILGLVIGWLALWGPLVGPAHAATNASSAAAFIESAQNSDGGFSASYGGPDRSGGASSPSASLWATVALLAAGKNPQDEALNQGASAETYLAGHLAALRSLTDLGLLAMIQAASGAAPALYGTPGAALKTDLTPAEVAADPAGAALGVLGLVGLHDTAAARATVTTLIGDQATDGGWAERGTDPSAATALVLQALAATHLSTSTSGAAALKRGLGYLHGAQINDGSIAQSDASATTGSGDVAATAFTVQALAALHHAPLRTSTGVTVLAGLANYQQQSGNGQGGLSPYGAYDTGVAPSVIQTAEAYSAFDGVAFPLPSVAPTPPPTVTTTPARAPAPARTPAPVNRASTGHARHGISAAGAGPRHAAAAYQGASAAGRTGARPKPEHHGVTAPSTGAQVSGAVINAVPPPKLTSAAGRPPTPDHSAFYLSLGLAAVALLGGWLELRRPRRRDRSALTTAVARTDAFGRWFAARGSRLPAAGAGVGLALVLLPTVTGMWSRAPKTAAMLRAFRPFMAEAHLSRLRGDVALLSRAVSDTARLPGVRSFATAQWPGIHRHFAGTLDTVNAQRGHFQTLTGLPSFARFPGFLLGAGGLLLVVCAVALWRPGLWHGLRWAVTVIGLGLVLAPLSLGLFSAGGQGATLIRAFARVETRANVTALQTGFSGLVIGESSITSAVAGHADTRRYPAGAALGRHFTQILGDFTPLLGVMSDNVANYRAAAALPDFRAFPWLFAVPGLLAVLIALSGAPRELRIRRLAGAGLSHPPPQGATDAT